MQTAVRLFMMRRDLRQGGSSSPWPYKQGWKGVLPPSSLLIPLRLYTSPAQTKLLSPCQHTLWCLPWGSLLLGLGANELSSVLLSPPVISTQMLFRVPLLFERSFVDPMFSSLGMREFSVFGVQNISTPFPFWVRLRKGKLEEMPATLTHLQINTNS